MCSSDLKLLDYLDGKLPPDEYREFEQLLTDDPELQAAWYALRELQAAGRDWQDVQVPRWSRLAGVTARPGGGWSLSGSLSWLSLATSTAAIILVLFQAQVSVSGNGFAVSFGGGAESEAALEQRLAAHAAEAESALDQRMEVMEKKKIGRAHV